jgi:hypothetical protein
VFHTIAGRPQISGPDVILAHRLLKNSQPNREYLMLTESAYRELGHGMDADFAESVESPEGFGSVKVYVQRLDGAVQRERDDFYALPRASFDARVRDYARWGSLAHLRALAEHVRHPAVAVSWPRRVGFALLIALATPFVFAYITLVQPGRLRARHAEERLRGPSLR